MRSVLTPLLGLALLLSSPLIFKHHERYMEAIIVGDSKDL